jgi:hypothetical protein
MRTTLSGLMAVTMALMVVAGCTSSTSGDKMMSGDKMSDDKKMMEKK